MLGDTLQSGCWLLTCSVFNTSGLSGHRGNHDREVTQSSEWHRMVVEKPKHGNDTVFALISGLIY